MLQIHDIADLPDGYVINHAVVVMECIAPDGEVTMLLRSSPNVKAWQSIGMLTSALVVEQTAVQEAFEEGD